MTRFMVRVYEAEPNTNTRWKPLLIVKFDDEHEPEHGGYTPLEWDGTKHVAFTDPIVVTLNEEGN